MMTVTIFNAKYSPNLGDGVLATCMEVGLREYFCRESIALDVETTDIAARTEFKPGSARRSTIIRMLNRAPQPIRSRMVAVAMKSKLGSDWLPHYRQGMAGSTSIVVGGGNLLLDRDLNFPTKIAGILQEAKARKLLVHIYAVGVAEGWSDAGLEMVRRGLGSAHISSISVRDERSKAVFDHLFGDVALTPGIVRDPGLLISKYAESPNTPDERKVGVCITDGAVISYHSEKRFANRSLLRWYVDLIEELERRGFSVHPFTNGSPEDIELARTVISDLKRPKLADRNLVTPHDPIALARNISQFGTVVAFRMHALIAGFSFGCGLVALEWDHKVKSFMESVGLQDQTIWPFDHDVSVVADMVEVTGSKAADRRRVEAVIHDAEQDLFALGRRISVLASE